MVTNPRNALLDMHNRVSRVTEKLIACLALLVQCGFCDRIRK